MTAAAVVVVVVAAVVAASGTATLQRNVVINGWSIEVMVIVVGNVDDLLLCTSSFPFLFFFIFFRWYRKYCAGRTRST